MMGIIIKISVVKGDITTAKVDVIVNAANKQLQAGGGVCGAIFRASGHIKELQEECNIHAPLKTREACLTDGYDLPCKYICHAVGPIYVDDKTSEPLLESTYKSALYYTDVNGFKSIAFPLISAGIYGYPLDKAIDVAIKTINNYNYKNVEQVYIYCINDEICKAVEKTIKIYE